MLKKLVSIAISTSLTCFPAFGQIAKPAYPNDSSSPERTAMCVYTASAFPVLVSGQAIPLQCNSSGQLITSGSGSGGGPVTAIAGAFVDGSIIPMGSTTDAAWSGSGSASLIAIEKKIEAVLAAIQTAINAPMQQTGGSVTANAGTNLNTSLLALESGGNLASLVTQLGAVTASPTANTMMDRLKTINTTLNAPFQAGGSIGNTGFNALQAGANQSASNPGFQVLTSQYPTGAIPITASSIGTTASTAATLNADVSTKVYICGFSIRANATAVATGNAQVAGTVTGSLNFLQWTAPAASGIGVVEQQFIPCIPASAVNTNVSVASAAPGTGGNVEVVAWGYKL